MGWRILTVWIASLLASCATESNHPADARPWSLPVHASGELQPRPPVESRPVPPRAEKAATGGEATSRPPASLTPSPPSSSPERDVTFQALASATRVSVRGGTIALRLRLAASRLPETPRAPVNLALVFDRSSSMNEHEKIGFLREAAHLLANQLLPTDRVALVAFNETTNVLVPSHLVIHREYLHHRIEELFARGQTNLSAGLFEGYAQVVADSSAGETPGHLILLTDGLANRGITDPGRLVEHVKRKRQQGITLSAIGLGSKFDEKLLSAVARAGGGRYVYLREPEEMPAALRKELGSLLEVRAQNVRVKIGVSGGIRIGRILGPVLEHGSRGTENLTLSDLTAGDETSLVVFLSVPPAPPGNRASVTCELVFDNARSGQREKLEQHVSIESTDSPTPPDRQVDAYARLVQALDIIEQAVEGLDEELARSALEILEAEFPALKTTAMASDDQDLINKAFLFHHFATELGEFVEQGLLHGHSEAREQFKKDIHYRRYLLGHHDEGH